MNRTLVGISRCDVHARAPAGGTNTRHAWNPPIAPLDAARTAQRAVLTWFVGEFRIETKPASERSRLQGVNRQRGDALKFSFDELGLTEGCGLGGLRRIPQGFAQHFSLSFAQMDPLLRFQVFSFGTHASLIDRWWKNFNLENLRYGDPTLAQGRLPALSSLQKTSPTYG